MILTKEILEKNGFVTNHPERVLPKYHYSNPEGSYRVDIQAEYFPGTNVLGWNVSGWSTINGKIIRRASASVIETVEDLQSLINLCKIDLLIYSE